MQIFNLKKEWFEKIKSGEKTIEYREATEYWNKRILKIILSHIEDEEEKCITYWFTRSSIETKSPFSIPVQIPIILTCGYPSKENKDRRLLAMATRIELIKNGRFTDLKIDKPVYAIKFELI